MAKKTVTKQITKDQRKKLLQTPFSKGNKIKKNPPIFGETKKK